LQNLIPSPERAFNAMLDLTNGALFELSCHLLLGGPKTSTLLTKESVSLPSPSLLGHWGVLVAILENLVSRFSFFVFDPFLWRSSRNRKFFPYFLA